MRMRGWPAQRADPAHQLGRAEDAVAMEEARREIGDLDAVPCGIEKARPHDRGAVLVALLDAAQAFELDAQLPSVAAAVGRVEQRMEHGIAVEARHAAPDDGAARDRRGR